MKQYQPVQRVSLLKRDLSMMTEPSTKTYTNKGRIITGDTLANAERITHKERLVHEEKIINEEINSSRETYP